MTVPRCLCVFLISLTFVAHAAWGQFSWQTKMGSGTGNIFTPFVSPVLAAQDAGRLPVLDSDKGFSVDKAFAASGIMGDMSDVAIKQGEKGVLRFIYEPKGRGDHEWDYKFLDGELNPDP